MNNTELSNLLTESFNRKYYYVLENNEIHHVDKSNIKPDWAIFSGPFYYYREAIASMPGLKEYP